MSETQKTPEPLPSQLEFDTLVQRANAGDAEALAKLRQVLDEHPEIWQNVGNLAQHAKMNLVRLIAGSDQLVTESLLRSADDLEKKLAGPSPSPLEQLSARRVAACWLQLQFTNTLHPQPDGQTLRQQKFVLKLKESAERLFDNAVRSLALVRKLVPNVASAKPQAVQEPAPMAKNRKPTPRTAVATGRPRPKPAISTGRPSPRWIRARGLLRPACRSIASNSSCRRRNRILYQRAKAERRHAILAADIITGTGHRAIDGLVRPPEARKKRGARSGAIPVYPVEKIAFQANRPQTGLTVRVAGHACSTIDVGTSRRPNCYRSRLCIGGRKGCELPRLDGWGVGTATADFLPKPALYTSPICLGSP